MLKNISLDSAKASQNTDIPTKSGNADIFPDFLLSGFNHSIRASDFPIFR